MLVDVVAGRRRPVVVVVVEVVRRVGSQGCQWITEPPVTKFITFGHGWIT